MAEFWTRAIAIDPSLVGTTVYFSPSKGWNLPCIIREDGTVSPVGSLDLRFCKIGELVDAWTNGVITDDNGRKLLPRLKSPKLAFTSDFFFKEGRQEAVREIIRSAKFSPAKAQKKQCPGFDSRPHLPVVAHRKWDGSRTAMSPVIIQADRCRSKLCVGLIDVKRSLCEACRTDRQRLWNARRFLKTPTTERRRIMYCPSRWLTRDEVLKKMEYKVEDGRQRLKDKSRQISSMRSELNRYRPKERENQKAIREVVKKMDNEERKVRQPICQWMVNDHETCGYRATSIIELLRHLREDHYSHQREANKGRSIFDGKTYTCEWKGCKRLTAFRKFCHLRRHVAEHTGTTRTAAGLEILREQMINWSRPPNGRRYGKKIKQVILAYWRGQGAHKRAQKLSTLPYPSGRQITDWKNHGGIKSGPDWTILKEMQELGKAAPELTEGFLTFDEVSPCI